jgi:glyoxylase-like metal-dependent hydrolase (beta-lactamase superfamily II)
LLTALAMASRQLRSGCDATGPVLSGGQPDTGHLGGARPAATGNSSVPVHWADAGTFPVAPAVYRIPLPLPSDALRAVNIYAIDHGDSVTLIDGGWATAQTAPALERGLAALGYRFTDISQILVTHMHRDHYSEAVAMRRRWGTHIALGHGEADSLRAIRAIAEGTGSSSNPARLRAAGAAELAAMTEQEPRRQIEPDYYELPDEWIGAGPPIALKGRSLDAIETPGHTRGHLTFLDGAAASLYAGDHLLPHITPSIGYETAPGDSPLGSYLQSLALMKQLPDLQLLPAHGPPGMSTHQRADELLAHHERRLDQSADAVAAGAQTGLEVAQRLRWTRRERKLAELDSLNQTLAVLETVAHLKVLVAQGRVQRTVLDHVDHYQPGDTGVTASPPGRAGPPAETDPA